MCGLHSLLRSRQWNEEKSNKKFLELSTVPHFSDKHYASWQPPGIWLKTFSTAIWDCTWVPAGQQSCPACPPAQSSEPRALHSGPSSVFQLYFDTSSLTPDPPEVQLAGPAAPEPASRRCSSVGPPHRSWLEVRKKYTQITFPDFMSQIIITKTKTSSVHTKFTSAAFFTLQLTEQQKLSLHSFF